MPERRILTLHIPQSAGVMDQLLTAVEAALHGTGAERVWIDPASTHDLVVMADLPESAAADLADVAEGGSVAADPVVDAPGEVSVDGVAVPAPRGGTQVTAD